MRLESLLLELGPIGEDRTQPVHPRNSTAKAGNWWLKSRRVTFASGANWGLFLGANWLFFEVLSLPTSNTSPPYLPMVKTHELMRCQENELAILKLGARRGDPWRLGFLGLAWNLPICIAMNGLDSHGINVVGKYSVSFLYRWWCFRYLWNFHPDYLGGKFDPHVVFVCFCSPGLVQPPTRRKNVLMMRPGGRMWFVWKGR